MVVSRAAIERLRTEADTIFTRLERVTKALERARSEAGDHWEQRELELDLETPTGETIAVTLDLDCSAAENAQQRYERASELESKLAQREAVAGKLAPIPAAPLAYLVLHHLAATDGDGSRSMAGDLDADHDRVADCCAELVSSGHLEVDREATPTTYRLTDDGRAIRSFLEEREGKLTFLRWLDDPRTLARRISRGGPDYPRMTANELGMELTHVRHCYRSMAEIDLVETYDGSIIKGTERKLKPKDETHRKHTYYVTTDVADRLLRELDDDDRDG
ncbi:DUF2250 domain-containing protein [Natronolimnohabitans sp. A-GB9]|uniref:DUF2250 domain-containing protein n=1 Tax=Natronolimnohabitans sp. A-GB9 TaxID=3069757 RepID=UPI0027B162E4|nr:DUF2250 domain-containing protein [Natronolimnohabitans sp. A-GB9]MDQ2050585.1 DUF2250 domain-containing protein [Natronolimnohabitans sp. A-GB9]